MNSQPGNEWITIKGNTDRKYTIKVTSYSENPVPAIVNYSWGNTGEPDTWGQ